MKKMTANYLVSGNNNRRNNKSNVKPNKHEGDACSGEDIYNMADTEQVEIGRVDDI